ncbi:tetratricopeptide repeat protein [Aquirufa sp. ROCK2-A2]
MKKSLAILLIIGLGLIALIFQLPKGNVSNKQNAVAGTANRDANGMKEEVKSSPNEESHSAPLTAKQQKEISSLKLKLAAANSENTQLKVLDQLIKSFVDASRIDSAAFFAEQFSNKYGSLPNVLKTAQLYFEAQTYAIDSKKGSRLGEKAREYFEKALSLDPNNLLVKTNMAMTYVDTPTPMKGITLLREVIEQEPTYVPALFNLGLLSIKSNQFGKGQERFTQILKLEPNNFKAALNLGFCLAQLDKHDEAEKVLNRVLKQSKDAEEQKAAQELLAEMQKH